MGNCDSCHKSTSTLTNPSKPTAIYDYPKKMHHYISNKVSFRCIYHIKDYNEIQIINDRDKATINEEIKSKLKILNDNKKEELVFKINLIRLDITLLILSLKII